MFRAVIFDMDGLMLDTEKLCRDSWDYAGEKCGVGKLGYMSLKTIGMNIHLTREVFKKELGEDFDVLSFEKHSMEYGKSYYSSNAVPVKPGLLELLEFLKNNGFKMAVASSTAAATVKKLLGEIDVLKYFQAVVCGDMVEHSKPHPAIYEKAVSALGEEARYCLVLEDSKSGLLSGHRAGCSVVMIPDLWPGDAETDRILFRKVNSLHEVIDVLEAVSKDNQIML